MKIVCRGKWVICFQKGKRSGLLYWPVKRQWSGSIRIISESALRKEAPAIGNGSSDGASSVSGAARIKKRIWPLTWMNNGADFLCQDNWPDRIWMRKLSILKSGQTNILFLFRSWSKNKLFLENQVRITTDGLKFVWKDIYHEKQLVLVLWNFFSPYFSYGFLFWAGRSSKVIPWSEGREDLFFH